MTSSTAGGHPDTEPTTRTPRRASTGCGPGCSGANDGIVSVAGVVVGVAGATTDRPSIAIAGAAALAAGALSMAVGEYVSVSSQRDSERALLDLERRELAEAPEEELEELVGLHRATGLSDGLARAVAQEQTAHDALAAHARVELGHRPRGPGQPLARRGRLAPRLPRRRRAARSSRCSCRWSPRGCR